MTAFDISFSAFLGRAEGRQNVRAERTEYRLEQSSSVNRSDHPCCCLQELWGTAREDLSVFWWDARSQRCDSSAWSDLCGPHWRMGVQWRDALGCVSTFDSKWRLPSGSLHKELPDNKLLMENSLQPALGVQWKENDWNGIFSLWGSVPGVDGCPRPHSMAGAQPLLKNHCLPQLDQQLCWLFTRDAGRRWGNGFSWQHCLNTCVDL